MKIRIFYFVFLLFLKMGAIDDCEKSFLDDVQAGNMDKVKNFFENEGNIDVKNSNGVTALYLACQNGHEEIARYLIDKKANIDIQDANGNTILHASVFNGHINIVKFLIEEKNFDIDIKENQALTPLMLVCYFGHKHIVQYLIEKKASIDVKNSNGLTALYLAYQNGHEEIARYLIDKKANIGIQDSNGNTILHVSVFNGHMNIIKFLIEEKNIDVNIKSNNNTTPLITSAENGCMEVMKYLIAKGASVDAQTNGGITALYLTCQNGHEEMAKYLIEKGADIGVRDTAYGNAILHASALNSHIDIIKFLIEKQNFNVDIRSNIDTTPLTCAVQLGSIEIVKYLIKKGADVEIKEYSGFNPVYRAIFNGHKKILDFFLKQPLLLLSYDTSQEVENDKSMSSYSIDRFGHSFKINTLIKLFEKINKKQFCMQKIEKRSKEKAAALFKLLNNSENTRCETPLLLTQKLVDNVFNDPFKNQMELQYFKEFLLLCHLDLKNNPDKAKKECFSNNFIKLCYEKHFLKIKSLIFENYVNNESIVELVQKSEELEENKKTEMLKFLEKFKKLKSFEGLDDKFKQKVDENYYLQLNSERTVGFPALSFDELYHKAIQ